jgi:hypothetical protein
VSCRGAKVRGRSRDCVKRTADLCVIAGAFGSQDKPATTGLDKLNAKPIFKVVKMPRHNRVADRRFVPGGTDTLPPADCVERTQG